MALIDGFLTTPFSVTMTSIKWLGVRPSDLDRRALQHRKVFQLVLD